MVYLNPQSSTDLGKLYSTCIAAPLPNGTSHQIVRQIVRQMKKCQSNKVLLVLSQHQWSEMKWIVSLLNIANTLQVLHYIVEQTTDEILSCSSFIPYNDVLLLFQIQECKFKCVCVCEAQ